MSSDMSSELAKRAAEAVDEGFLLELCQSLVRIRSVYEPEQGNTEQAVAEFLAERLQALGLSPILQNVTPERPNLIADWEGSDYDPSKHKTLMFEGHSDVVTEGEASTWQHPPFSGELIDGKVYGRGSADMKGGIAAAIAALAAVQRVAPDIAGRIRLGVVVDEEGMMIGIKDFIRQGWADEVDGAIICEPEENELCLFQKGAMRVSITFTGVMSHGAMPYAGVNPIAALSSFIEQLKALEREEQVRLGEHPYLGLPWFTPTIVKAPPTGEAQLNVMPAQAYLALDIRTIPGQEHGDIEQRLRSIAEHICLATPKLSIDLDVFESRPWTSTPQDDGLVLALEQAYPLVLDKDPKYGGVPGATDGTFLNAWAKIPTVTVGPGDRTIPHQKDEFVRLADLLDAARLYASSSILYFCQDTA